MTIESTWNDQHVPVLMAICISSEASQLPSWKTNRIPFQNTLYFSPIVGKVPTVGSDLPVSFQSRKVQSNCCRHPWLIVYHHPWILSIIPCTLLTETFTCMCFGLVLFSFNTSTHTFSNWIQPAPKARSTSFKMQMVHSGEAHRVPAVQSGSGQTGFKIYPQCNSNSKWIHNRHKLHHLHIILFHECYTIRI